MPERLFLVGQRFGKLQVVAPAPTVISPAGRYHGMSKCLCDCGTALIVRNESLRSGNTSACGCHKLGKRNHNFLHGMSRTRIFSVWKGMLARCCNPNRESFKDYGGRGITICNRWKVFKNFLADMGEGRHGWTLERLDNNLGYCPENCCWAKRIVQARNMRSNSVFTVRGKTACLSELCEHFSTNYKRTQRRLSLGWDIESALTIPQLSHCAKP